MSSSTTRSHQGGVEPLAKRLRTESIDEAQAILDHIQAQLEVAKGRDQVTTFSNQDNEIPDISVGNDSAYEIKEDPDYEDALNAIGSIWLALGQIKYPYRISFGPTSIPKIPSHDGIDPITLTPNPVDAALFVFRSSSGITLVICEAEGPYTNQARFILPTNIGSRTNTNSTRQPFITDCRQRIEDLMNAGELTFPENTRCRLNDATDDWRRCFAEAGKDVYHVILNAWAYMLDIPVQERRTENGKSLEYLKDVLRISHENFYSLVHECIRLSLEGKMDYRTIDSLLSNTGYAYDHSVSTTYECIGPKYRKRLEKLRTVYVPQSGIEIADKPGEGQELSTATNWQQYLSERLEYWNRMRKAAGVPKEKDEHIESDFYLDADQMTFAIASMWLPCTHGGTTNDFAFGHSNLWNAHRFDHSPGVENMAPDMRPRTIALRTIRDAPTFLIPLTIDKRELGKRVAQKQQPNLDKEKLHNVLVLPKWEAAHTSGHKPTVSITVYDSCQSFVSDEDLQDAAKNIVQKSGWLGWGLKDGNDVKLNSGAATVAQTINRVICPSQQGSSECGIYVVINAWCVMLGIDVINNFRRNPPAIGEKEEHINLLRDAREMFNLAMDGFMDEHTFEVFTKAYGFAQTEDTFDRIKVKYGKVGYQTHAVTLISWTEFCEDEYTSAVIQQSTQNPSSSPNGTIVI